VTNYVPMHSWDYTDSDCLLYYGVECKDVELISKKDIHSLTHKHTPLYTLVQVYT